MARAIFNDHSVDAVLERSRQKTLRRLSQLARDYRNGMLPRALSRDDLEYIERLRQRDQEKRESRSYQKLNCASKPAKIAPHQMTFGEFKRILSNE